MLFANLALARSLAFFPPPPFRPTPHPTPFPPFDVRQSPFPSSTTHLLLLPAANATLTQRVNSRELRHPSTPSHVKSALSPPDYRSTQRLSKCRRRSVQRIMKDGIMGKVHIGRTTSVRVLYSIRTSLVTDISFNSRSLLARRCCAWKASPNSSRLKLAFLVIAAGGSRTAFPPDHSLDSRGHAIRRPLHHHGDS